MEGDAVDDGKWPAVLDLPYYSGSVIVRHQNYQRAAPAVLKMHWSKLCVEYIDPQCGCSILFEDDKRYKSKYLPNKRYAHDQTAMHRNAMAQPSAPPAAPMLPPAGGAASPPVANLPSPRGGPDRGGVGRVGATAEGVEAAEGVAAADVAGGLCRRRFP